MSLPLTASSSGSSFDSLIRQICLPAAIGKHDRRQSFPAIRDSRIVKIKLKMPRFGMNMEEATIVKWHKGVGESFVEGEAIYEVETDKVTQVVDASGSGTLLEILVPEGEEAQVGDAICVVEAG
jgi:hypothetical protein